MAEIKGIEFEVKGSSDKAVASLEKLIETLSNLKKVTAGGLGLGSAAKEMENASKASESQGKSASESLAKQSHKMRDLYDAAKNMRSLWTDLSGAAKLYAENGVISVNALQHRLETFNPFKYAAATVWQPLTKGLAFVEDQLDKSGVSLRDLASTERVATDNATPFVYALESMKLGFLGILSGAGKAVSAIGKGFVGALKLAGKGLLSVAKGAGKLAGNLLAAPFKKAIKPVSNFVSSLKSVASSFKRILFYRIIRTVIKEIGQALSEGVKNVYQWSKAFGGPVNGSMMTFAETMDDIATSISYFKNGVGAAIAPLYNLLAPALRAVTDAAVELLNVVNQLIARLTGQSSWTKAIRKATEYGDAVGGAGGAAKEALKYLAPFDELNVLPSQKSGGGGGSPGDDFGGMFEETEDFADDVSDFADKIKAAIDSANWKELGTLLGEKLNSIINGIDFAGIGSKIGGYINAWFTTKYWTLKSINFENIGKKIAEFLTGDGKGKKGIVGSIDFEVIGRGIVQGFANIGNLIIGGIENIKWKTVTKKLSDFISGVFKEASDFVSKKDWGQMVRNAFKIVVDAVKGIDLKKLLKNISSLLGSVSGAVFDIVGTLAVDIISLLTDKKTWKLIGAWLKDLPAKLKNFGVQAINAFVTSFAEGWNKFVKKYNASSIADVLGKLDPIEFELIPEIPESELTKNYNAAKKELEKQSKTKPATFTATAAIKSAKDSIPSSKKYIPNFTAKVGVAKDVIKSGQKTIKGFRAEIKQTVDKVPSKDKKVTGVKAILESKKDEIPTAEKSIVGFNAKVKSAVDNINADKKNLAGFKAKLSKVDKSALSEKQKTISTISKYTASNFSGLSNADRTVDTMAFFQKTKAAPSVNDGYGNVSVDATANITRVTGTTSIATAVTLQANGGVFKNNAWHSIPQFANGGRPHGSLFVAGESGAELVGHIGGRTEVLNRSQIASSIYAAVRNAMSGIVFRAANVQTAPYSSETSANEEAMYRAFSRALADSDLGGDIELDGDVLYKHMVRRNRQNTRLTGINAMA